MLQLQKKARAFYDYILIFMYTDRVHGVYFIHLILNEILRFTLLLFLLEF